MDPNDAGSRVDASHYEDALILFVIRLLQLQGKRYYREWKLPNIRIDWNEDETVITSIGITETAGDEEFFVSYLSVVRQFWAKNDALNVHRIKGILLWAARLLQDADLRDRIKKADKEFRDRWNKVEHIYCDGHGKELLKLSQHELAAFWFNTVYFHTEPGNLDIAVPLLQSDGFRTWSRRQFQAYLYHLVRYAQQLGSEVVKILWKGVFPKGKLHHLLEMYVPLDLYASERSRRSTDASPKTPP